MNTRTKPRALLGDTIIGAEFGPYAAYGPRHEIDGTAEQCPPLIAEFWGVYVWDHSNGGGWKWAADCANAQLALLLSAEIAGTSEVFTADGGR